MTTDDTDDETLETLAEYLRLNPDATTPEVLGATDTDPAVWGDLVDDALATAEPHLALETPDTDAPEGDSRESNPTPEADKPASTAGDPDETESYPTESTGNTDCGVTTAAAPALANGRAVVGEQRHPETVVDRDWWVAWLLDGVGRKRPVAPWQTGHAYPVEWSADLDADERPETDHATASRWTDFGLDELNLSLPDDAQSDELDLGIILPADRPPRDERITLIDWDDVRDPETERVHPVALDYIRRFGGYVEVSTSGEGLHQFVRGGLRKRGKFIAPIDDEPFVGDDLPQVELYDGGRHVAMTGRHVVGTGTDVVDDGQELIDELVREYADAERDAGYRRYDPETGEGGGSTDDTGTDAGDGDVPEPETGEYDGPPLDDLLATKPEDRPLRYHAVVEAFYRGAGNADGYAGVLNWRLEGMAAALGDQAGLSAEDVKDDLAGAYLDDTDVERGCRHETPHRVDYAHERAGTERFAAPSAETLVEYGVLPDGALDETGRRVSTVETCAPPAVDRVAVDDITDRWRAIRARLNDLGDGPTIFADEAGSGKTTNTGIGLAERDDSHAILFDKHEKAREYVRDDATPCEYFHLKGGGQPRDDACLDAHHAGERCDDHGDTANCPRMCPVYDLDPDDPVRVEYERLVDEVGPVRAHQLLGDELPDHDEDGAGPWLNQFDAAARAERVVGVHEYQTLKTVTNPANGPARQVVVDETPSVDGRERLLDVETLVRLSNALEPRRNVSAPDDDPTEHNHLHARAELAAFARRVVDALTDPDAPDDLAGVDAPAFAPTTVEVEVDPDNLPVGIDPEDVRTDTRKRDVGMPGEGYETVRCHVAEVDLLAETLAHAKQAYEGAVLGRIRSDDKEWNGEPLATDALLAAAAAAGVDARACRQAAAVPPELSGCPRCHEDLEPHDGRLVCPSCAWDEAEDYLVGRDGDAARCDAELHTGGDGTGLHYRRLPHPSELPVAPLVLDATATPDKVAALYGVDRDAVDVYGDDTLAVDQLRTTQVLDGQYHASTIRDTDSVRERVVRTVRKVADVHGELLVVGKLSILDTLDLPTDRDGVDVLHYHAARGLNRAGYDAVVAVGAPHPDVDDLRRDAALLTQDRDDLRVGGVEHSTRRDCEQPPVYRKLDYADDGGDGRAVPTKHYTGLTGALFREGREKEVEQVVHRIRPLLADDDQHAYLLTNVPTDLRVDEVCSFDELADPLETLLPVPEGALELADAVRAAAAGDLDVDGVRPDRLVETVGGERGDEEVAFKIDALHRLATAAGLDVCERTVRRWVDGLTDLGLLDAREYEPQAGVPYAADPATLTQALSVLSNNACVKVAARRRFRAILAEADGTLSWLDRARDLLGLRGGGDEVDPPPRSASPAD